MGLTYFKRYRMEIDLTVNLPTPSLPAGFRFVAWQPDLLSVHADTKYRCFRTELDANVFSCLGDVEGCMRLMTEICHKDGFLAEATWLMAYAPASQAEIDYCGTVQGVRDQSGLGAIQNLGITPEFRGLGLGTCLLLKSLDGFRGDGLRRVFLEVTSQNEGAIKLYRRLGFCKARTVYKAVEMAYY